MNYSKSSGIENKYMRIANVTEEHHLGGKRELLLLRATSFYRCIWLGNLLRKCQNIVRVVIISFLSISLLPT